MKRSILILLLSVLILLAGCRSDPPVISDTFEAQITISGGTIDCSAELSRTPQAVIVTLTAPSSVAGICYTYTKGELHTSYGELSCITDSASLPPSSAPMLLCEALRRLDEAAYDSSEDDRDVFRLRLSEGEAIITCVDGFPQTITASFSPYTVTLEPKS